MVTLGLSVLLPLLSNQLFTEVGCLSDGQLRNKILHVFDALVFYVIVLAPGNVFNCRHEFISIWLHPR